MASKRMRIPFTGEAKKGKNTFLNSEECINYYPEPAPSATVEGEMALRGSPGLIAWASLGAGRSIRGWVVAQDVLYVVAGPTLFSIDTAGNVITIGAVDLSEDIVSLITNSLIIGIFGGANGYVYTIATATLAIITDANFPGATTATYQDGFALVNRPGTQQFYKSGLNDFSSWGFSDFSTAAWQPDDLLAIFSDHRDVWLPGSESIEIWYNTGAATFPFSRREGAEMEIGLAAQASMSAGDNGVFWLSRSKTGEGMVMRALSLIPKKISTREIDEAINSYTTIDDAIGFTYQHDGNIKYELVFPTESKSWVFNSTTGLWNERQSFVNNVYGRHRIQLHVFFAGKNLVGDMSNGKIYELTRDAYDEDGTEMVAVRTSQTLKNNQDLITYYELQVLFSPGVGLSTDTDYLANPKAMLSWSDDGGKTWGNEMELTMGAVGEYENRAIIYRLGQGRNRLFRVKVSTPVKRDILGAFAQIEVDQA